MRYLLIIVALSLAAIEVARAASPFDALYEGTVTIEQRPRKMSTCPGETPLHIRVKDGGFKYRWGDATVTETIGPDGAFSASDGRITLSGKIAGSNLEGFLVGEVCTYRLKAARPS